MFEQIDASPFQSPLAFWALGAVFFVVLARRQRFLFGYFTLFGLEILADAYATGGLSPIPATAAWSSWATGVAIAFVILGDLRFFVLLEVFRGGGRARGLAPFARALGWALIVPVSSTIAKFALAPRNGRVTFLIYEVMFLALALTVRFVVLPRRAASLQRSRSEAPWVERAWLESLTHFEIAQYALWVVADVLILTGQSWAFVLRIAPNTLYYAGFLPFAMRKAPEEAFA